MQYGPTQVLVIANDYPYRTHANFIMDVVHMPIDNDGYQYALVIGDMFSKYIQAVPMRDLTAKTIVAAFSSHWLYMHGNPYYSLTD